MKKIEVVLLVFASVNCGSAPSSPPASPPASLPASPQTLQAPSADKVIAPVSSVVDRSSPQTVVDAYFRAAEAGDKKAMLDLFVPEARAEEGSSKKAFTSAIADLGYKFLGADARSPLKVEGDAATVGYRGRFREPEGREKGDGMRFTLAKKDGVWSIVSIQ